jgi:hypothetical protein
MRKKRGMLLEIIKSRVIFCIPLIFFILGPSTKSFFLIRYIYFQRKVKYLEKKFRNELDSHPIYDCVESVDNEKIKTWTFWDKGFENSPDIVRICSDNLNSIKKLDVKHLSNESWSDYVDLPKHIVDKYRSGIIPTAHFSDILRIELLFKHGGVWLDSTVLVTSPELPQPLSENKLFFYGANDATTSSIPFSFSTWAISSPKGHPLFLVLRKWLSEYWEKKNYLSDYLLVHLLISVAIKVRPDFAPEKFGLFNNFDPHLASKHYNEEFESRKAIVISQVTPIHKLNHRFGAIMKNSFLEKIINTNGRVLFDAKD